MSTLLLIRHGQASFFSDDYDKLSPLGEEQSSLAGAYLAKNGIAFDAVFTGTLHRQTGTARHAAAAARASGIDWPAPSALPHFNEYDADGVMKGLLPSLKERDARFREMDAVLAAAVAPRDRYRAFHHLLTAVMVKWQAGEMGDGGFETWAAFRDRVREGLRQAMAGAGGGRRVAVFTSGGPIGTAVQWVMQSPEPVALELNWRVHNASITEVVFSGDRLTLASFNAIGHLNEPRLRTFR